MVRFRFSTSGAWRRALARGRVPDSSLLQLACQPGMHALQRLVNLPAFLVPLRVVDLLEAAPLL